MEVEIYVGKTKYIRADVAENWRKQRDVMKKSLTKVHQEVHASRRAVIEIEKQDRSG